MSIEELLKDNNDMLKQILQQLGNNNNNNEGLKSKQSYIDDLPDATMSATITESKNENSTNNQQGGNIKKIRLRRGVDSFKADPNKLGGDFSTRDSDDIEEDENFDEENDEEIFEINKNEPTKIGGDKPPKVLKILSIKTDKKKSKKSKKIKKSNKTKKTKTTSNKTTSGKKTKKTLTGYQLFMKEQMPIWKKKNPKKTHKEAFGAIAKLWKLQKK